MLLGHFSCTKCLIHPFSPGSMSQWHRGQRFAETGAFAVRHSFNLVWVAYSRFGMASLHLGHRLQYLCCSHQASRWLLRLVISTAWWHSLQRVIMVHEEQRCLSLQLSSQKRLSKDLQQSQQYSGFWGCFLSGVGVGFQTDVLLALAMRFTGRPEDQIFSQMSFSTWGLRFYRSGYRFSQPISWLMEAMRLTAAVRTSLLLSQRCLLQKSMTIAQDFPNLNLPTILVDMLRRPIVTLGTRSFAVSLYCPHKTSQQSQRLVRPWLGKEMKTSSQVSLNFQLLWPKQSAILSRMCWMYLEAEPIGPGLNFLSSMPKKSTVMVRTLMILSSINLRTANKEAKTNSQLPLLSQLLVLLRVSLRIQIPFSRYECSRERRYQKVISLKMGKNRLHSSNCCGVSFSSFLTDGRVVYGCSSSSSQMLFLLGLEYFGGSIFFLSEQVSSLPSYSSTGYLSLGLILISSNGTSTTLFLGVLRSNDRLWVLGSDCLDGNLQ